MSNLRQLRFSSKAKYPTLESLQLLAEENRAGLSRLNPSQRRDLLEDCSARTEEEKADGIWPVVERAGGGRLTLAEHRQINSDQVVPAQLEASTRRGILSGMADGGQVGRVAREATPSAWRPSSH